MRFKFFTVFRPDGFPFRSCKGHPLLHPFAPYHQARLGSASAMAAYHYGHFEQFENQFYRDLIELRQSASPEEVLNLIRYLLTGEAAQEGVAIQSEQCLAQSSRLEQGFDSIICSDWAVDEFANFLNRCCYILINHWSTDSATKPLIRELVKLLQDVTQGEQTSRRASLLKQFHETRQYTTLIERAKAETLGLAPDAGVLPETPSGTSSARLGKLLYRYPCLYRQYFLRWDNSEAGRRAVRELQRNREQEFASHLRHYSLNLGRLRRTTGVSRPSSSSTPSQKSVTNPTLLSREGLQGALHEFSGAAGSSHRYRRSAGQALRTVYAARTHREVKQEVNQYLVGALQSYQKASYGQRRFNTWLDKKLEFTLPEQDGERPTEKLLVYTCTNLVDGFLAHPRDRGRQSDHLMFVDLVENIGPTFTVGLLLKLVLLCRRVTANVKNLRDRIAQRLAGLFEHYEQTDSHEVAWLLRCLDNLMIASTIHFGPEEPSMWRRMLQS